MSDATLRLPGFVNAHSHAFQRALRGRVEHVDPDHPHDDFWTWREAMYQAANAIDPDGAYEVALQLYREMVAAGYTAVGEFHYPHHQPGGEPYPDPNAMAKATAAAARDAGIEIVMLMTAYARAGQGLPPTPGQRRFCDPDVASYLARVDALASEMRVGLAPHSVRAVPRDWLEEITAYAASSGMVVHIHANEQRREIDESLAEYGLRPIELLAEIGLLGPRATVIHATHVSERELELLASSGATVCACPTTEANLGDGFLPALELMQHGVPICIGTDSNTIIDPACRAARDRALRAAAGGAAKRAGAARRRRAHALPARDRREKRRTRDRPRRSSRGGRDRPRSSAAGRRRTGRRPGRADLRRRVRRTPPRLERMT